MSTEQKLPELSGTVFWLIPSKAERVAFENEIYRLSQRFNTVPFSPHVTLGRIAADITSQDALIRLNKIFDTVKNEKIVAVIDRLKCTTSPYQNLIVTLKPSGDLDHIQKKIGSQFPGFIQKEEHHISLLYGKVPCDELDEEQTKLPAKLPDSICFSSLRIMHLAGDPDSWRVLRELNM